MERNSLLFFSLPASSRMFALLTFTAMQVNFSIVITITAARDEGQIHCGANIREFHRRCLGQQQRNNELNAHPVCRE